MLREPTGLSKHSLPATQEKTLHMDINRWSTPKSDWLYSLQPKMEKLYTVSKNNTRNWLWLRSWTPYCQIFNWRKKGSNQRRQWQPTPVLLTGKSHGQGSLVGCSPRGLKESDTTERLHFHFSLSCIGEGNGNPLPCSCLENPRDGGAWWAAVYEVAPSWTQLKWLSISSSSKENH